MGSLPLHPALVHIPLGLAFIIPFIALVLAAGLWRGKLARKQWSLVVALQAVLVAGGIVAMRTGGNEEERVEDVVAESAIERHESAAEAFTWGAGGALLLAAAVLVLPPAIAPAVAVAASLAMFVVMGLGVRVGHAGGQLVYVHNAASAYVTGNRESGIGNRRTAVDVREDEDDSRLPIADSRP